MSQPVSSHPARRQGRPQVYPKVLQQMLALMESGNLAPGSSLESESELCRRFGVSRPLIRRALAELSADGRIVSVPGKGHFLANTSGLPATGVVACIVGSTNSGPSWNTGHVSEILEGMDKAIHASPYRLLLDRIGPQRQSVGELVKPHIADLRGAVLVPLADTTMQQGHSGLMERSLRWMLDPIPARVRRVVAGRSATQLGVCSVYVDHYAGMLQAMRYLIGQNHRHIGYIAPLGLSWPEWQRRKAYREAMEELTGTNEDPALVAMCGTEPDQVEQATAMLLERATHMTALVVSAGSLLPWVLRQLARRSVRIPTDLSLVSNDDVLISRQNLPSITVIRQPTQQLGLIAGQMLLEEIGSVSAEPREVVLNCELIVRESVCAVRGS